MTLAASPLRQSSGNKNRPDNFTVSRPVFLNAPEWTRVTIEREGELALVRTQKQQVLFSIETYDQTPVLSNQPIPFFS